MSNKPCEGCALSEGAAANQEPDNHLRAMIAVLTPVPFYCHATMDWQDAVTFFMPRGLLKSLGQLRVCEGWRREVAALAETGYFKENAGTTKLIGGLTLKALNNFLREDASPSMKEQARVELDAYLRLLVEKKRKFTKGRAAALAQG